MIVREFLKDLMWHSHLWHSHLPLMRIHARVFGTWACTQYNWEPSPWLSLLSLREWCLFAHPLMCISKSLNKSVAFAHSYLKGKSYRLYFVATSHSHPCHLWAVWAVEQERTIRQWMPKWIAVRAHNSFIWCATLTATHSSNAEHQETRPQNMPNPSQGLWLKQSHTIASSQATVYSISVHNCPGSHHCIKLHGHLDCPSTTCWLCNA